MATKHRRIGVVRDPELAAALAATRRLLDLTEGDSEAGQVRRLALIGAEALSSSDEGAADLVQRRRLLERDGVLPATRELTDLPWLDGETPDHDRKLSEALDWVRGQR